MQAKTILYREVNVAKQPPDTYPSFVWRAEVEVAIAVAGPLAEFRHRCRSRLGRALEASLNAELFLREGAVDMDGDFQRTRASLAHVADPDPLATFCAMIDVADAILAANWPNVGRLSRELLRGGRMDEDQLEDWFFRNPARYHPHPMRAVLAS